MLCNFLPYHSLWLKRISTTISKRRYSISAVEMVRFKMTYMKQVICTLLTMTFQWLASKRCKRSELTTNTNTWFIKSWMSDRWSIKTSPFKWFLTSPPLTLSCAVMTPLSQYAKWSNKSIESSNTMEFISSSHTHPLCSDSKTLKGNTSTSIFKSPKWKEKINKEMTWFTISMSAKNYQWTILHLNKRQNSTTK